MKTATSLLAIALFAPGDAPLVEPVRHATCVRYYSLEGDVKPDLLRRAVSELSAIEAEAKIAMGPSGVSSKPKYRFVVLEVPIGLPAKDIEKALRKTTPKVTELAWTAFQGEDRKLPDILGFSGPECVVGMDNDMRWFALEGGLARFFYVPGKLDATDLRSRFKTLYKPFDADELGELVRERIEWKLDEPLTAPAGKTAEKALGKLPGVVKAKIDVATRTLTVDIAHDGLRATAPPPGKEPAPGVPAGGFLANEALDALASAKVAVAGTRDSAGK
ncbi:MAG: hypothetical protein ACKVXR_05880 [Planctomycetota bacterium]